MTAAAVRIVPVADRAVLVEFDGEADDERAALVSAFDRRVRAAGPAGVLEVVPAYVNALVLFDPLRTDHAAVAEAVRPLVDERDEVEATLRHHVVPVVYGGDAGPDLLAVAEATGLSAEEVVAAHTSVEHRVVMFGFAPGAAYLSGVDASIRIPRKPAPVRDVPAGSVIIAGSQCLVMTVTMPTGWWVIGRSTIPMLATGAGGSFDVDVGDRIRFDAVVDRGLDAPEDGSS